MAWYLGFGASTAGVMGLIPGQETVTSHILQSTATEFKKKNLRK